MIDGASGTTQGGGRIQDPHHHNGRMSLLRIRGENQFRTSIGRSLFRVNHIHLVNLLNERARTENNAEFVIASTDAKMYNNP